MLKKLINIIKRVTTKYKSLDDMIEQLYSNAKSKAELFPYRFYDEKEMLYFLSDGVLGFWYALENFPQLLASMARTVRKYNGALVLGDTITKKFLWHGR